MTVNVNDCLHGFEFYKKTELADVGGVMHLARHKKSGAELLFLERADKNKTFAISFTTTPEDDTGVFHILEHSVLCGSRRFPVKEPFVELLKSSLYTFLNAMTYNDKTVYPVCSKNDRDFSNLVSVYMDAVFHPMMLENEKIFRQEGWHYEIKDGGELAYNGVVYNEMKGAYSSADDLANEIIMKMLYEGSCYAKDSGGDPDAIPTLTYERFTEAHRRYYHPSNAKILLDGEVDLDGILALLDGYLSEYDKIDTEISIPEPKAMPRGRRVAEYEIDESEDECGKARLILGYPTYSSDELEKNVALSLIRDYLAGSNEAPLKKALLDRGLCEDGAMYELDGIKRASMLIDVRNIKPENEQLIVDTVKDVIAKERRAGLNRERLAASLSSLEYRLREADYGSYPKGLMFVLSTLDTWLYGGSPSAPFRFTEILDGVRAMLKTDAPERIIDEIFREDVCQTLLLLPSKTLAERRATAEREELRKIKDSMSEGELKKIEEDFAALSAWQKSENSKEALATLPTLELRDVSTEPEFIPTEKSESDGAVLLYHPIEASGIVYSTLAFDCSDLTLDEIFTLSLASQVMLNVRTESYTTLQLQEKIKAALGLLSPSVTVYRGKGGEAIPVFVMKAHALRKNAPTACELISEVLYTSDLSDKAAVKNVISQTKIALEESFIGAGHQAAMSRADAQISPDGAINEYIAGYEAYRLFKEYEQNFDALSDSLIEEMKTLCDRVLSRGRLTVNVGGECEGELLSSLVLAAKAGEYTPVRCEIKPLPKQNEAIVIPSRVGYAGISNNLARIGESFSGSSQVARAIINYEHLWSSVRVQGGAYGAGVLMRKSGRVSFYSYRDPKPERTFLEFSKSGEFLREYAKKNTDLTSLIIGAVGNVSPLLTPRSATELALTRYFSGSSYEQEKQVLEELVSTDRDDILALADTLDKICEGSALCLVGSRENIAACGDLIEKILEL